MPYKIYTYTDPYRIAETDFWEEIKSYPHFCAARTLVNGLISVMRDEIVSLMCPLDDIVNETAAKFKDADGLVIGSPVYYASANGTLISFLDRLFYSSGFDKTMKVGASVVSARRGGCTATFDELNKYFTISGMPVASSQYWNQVHGNTPEEVSQDKEGLQTMRTLGRNIAFLIKSIALGKEAFGLPEKEKRIGTNFIR